MTAIPIPPDFLARIITLRDRTPLGDVTTLSDTGMLETLRPVELLSTGESLLLDAAVCLADGRTADVPFLACRAWLSAYDYDVLVEVTGMTQHRAPGAAGLMREVLR